MPTTLGEPAIEGRRDRAADLSKFLGLRNGPRLPRIEIVVAVDNDTADHRPADQSEAKDPRP
jgi:hypothetical protein